MLYEIAKSKEGESACKILLHISSHCEKNHFYRKAHLYLS